MPDIWLEPIKSENDLSLRGEALAQTGPITQTQGDSFLIPSQQIGHRPFGDHHSSFAKGLMNFWYTVVLFIAQCSNEGNHIKPERAMW